MPAYTILSLHMGEGFDHERDDFPVEVKNAYLDAAFGKGFQKAVEHGLYTASSVVEASDPEDLFAKTQHIDSRWDDKNTPAWAAGRLRSTSVGDAIIDHETSKVFACATVGWMEVEGDDATVLRGLRVEDKQLAPGI